MFKKGVVKVQTQSALGGKDQKRLKADLKSQFPALTDAVKLDTLFPAKEEIIAAKLAGGLSTVFYSGNEPLLFDFDGHGKLVPTVYAMWRVPDMVPAIVVHAPVSKFVMNGADLMLPGVVVPPTGLDDFLAASLRCVVADGNPKPLAVGQMLLSKDEAIAASMKGKGMRIIHSYMDLLYGLGPKTIPNRGFVADEVLPIELEEGADEPEAQVHAADAVASRDEPFDSACAIKVDSSHQQGSIKEAPKSEAVTIDDDSLVVQCFLLALKTKVNDKDLPKDASQVYELAKTLRPTGSTIDVKKTSYKKLPKLVKELEKRGIVRVKETKGVQNIIYVLRDHQQLLAAVPFEESTDLVAPSQPSGVEHVQILTLFRPSSQLLPITGGDKSTHLSRLQVSEALQSYCASNSLVDSDAIKLDDLLADAMYRKLSVAEKKDAGEVVSFDELLDRTLARMTEFNEVTFCGKTETVKGSLKPISLIVEDRHGGRKHVTRCSGIESYSLDAETLSKEWQRLYNCSASITPLPGKNEKGAEITVQGNVMAELIDFFVKGVKIPKRHIQVMDRTKK